MTQTTRLITALLILSSSILAVPQESLARDGEGRRWFQPTYQVASRQLVHHTYQHQYYYVTQPSEPELMPAAPAPEPEPEPVQVAANVDPYGFIYVLNQYRAMAGLPPVAYDPNLAAWASQNNAVQTHRGLGHHVNPNCFQNCGWNYGDAWSVARGWMNSPGHRANMLSQSISRIGIAYGPGPYWTMNAI